MERTTNQLSELDMTRAAPSADMPAEPNAGLLPDGSIDNEGAMVKADLYKLAQYSYKLFKKIEDNDQFESWVQAKVTKAADYIASVYHYLEYEMKFSEYGHQLDNSDVLSESQKRIMKDKLLEAKEKIKDLKKTQASKASGVSLVPPKGKITYTAKIAGSTKPKKVDAAKEGAIVIPPKLVAKKAKATTSGAGLSKDKKSAVVPADKASKKAPAFKKIDKTDTKSGAKDPKAAAAAAMWKNIKRKTVKENAELDGPNTLEQLLALQQSYVGTKWAGQIKYRIDWLQNHLDQNGGVMPNGRQLLSTDPILSPEEWARDPSHIGEFEKAASENPGEFDESQISSRHSRRPAEECTPCHGTGEGRHSGASCQACNGTGERHQDSDKFKNPRHTADPTDYPEWDMDEATKTSGQKGMVNESTELSVIKMLSGLK